MEKSDGVGEEGDLLGYALTQEDPHLNGVYRYWVHANDGTHLHGGIVDIRVWQEWWRDVTVMTYR